MTPTDHTASLGASHSYVCEHPDCPDERTFTFRTESSERYCPFHFPWYDQAERDGATAGLDWRQS